MFKTKKTLKPPISISLTGRLGNHMWQYAVIRTIAEKNQCDFALHGDFLGKGIFDCDLGRKFNIDDVNDVRMDQRGQKYNPDLMNAKSGDHLIGNFQCEKYFLNNKENVKKWFSFNENYQPPKDIKDVCIIVFRGGDYKTLMRSAFLKGDFYKFSMQKMRELHGNLKFMVVTDDPTEAKKHFVNTKIVHFDALRDLYLISHAKYLIIANSTFAWWGAWLNDRVETIIAPKFWFRYNQDDVWTPHGAKTKGFTYMDRNGCWSV